MASKKKTKTKRTRQAMAFAAGLVLPLCVVAGWHAAYGQQDTSREASRPALYSPQAPQERRLDPREELATLRPVFDEQVRKPTLKRIEKSIKMWAAAPKVVKALEARRDRLTGLGASYFDRARKDVAASMAKAGKRFDESQFFVYVDRNPTAQFVLVGLYDAPGGQIDFLGVDLISSGNLDKGGDYFETPLGVFENSIDNFSYRAMGTPNQEGWRGLGAKDSRVWDFGDQRGIKKYKNGTTLSQMRLLMHSTDPDKGEPRLGRMDSKGCIRISHGLNRFLDTYSILDRNYEEWAKTKPDSWLLRKDRVPSAYAGKYLIVGDSSLPLQASNEK